MQRIIATRTITTETIELEGVLRQIVKPGGDFCFFVDELGGRSPELATLFSELCNRWDGAHKDDSGVAWTGPKTKLTLVLTREEAHVG